MNKDQFKGRAKAAKGKIKEVIGRMIDDRTMGLEGNLQECAGKARTGWGDFKEQVTKTTKG